jgi:hypothetical protein
MTEHEHSPDCTHEKPMAQQVHDIMMRVLYTNDEVAGLDREKDEQPEGMVVVQGLVQDFGFHPERLMAEAENIRTILRKVVVDEFFEKLGWSFVNLCADRDGNQWAEHPTMEALVALSVGLGWARCVLPRFFWPVLPGGVPYYHFDFEKPPVLRYPYEIKPGPTTLDAEGEKRYAVWRRVSEMPPFLSGILHQMLWERLDVQPEDAKKMTSDERVWALTNAGIDPHNDEVKEALLRYGVDPVEIFGAA